MVQSLTTGDASPHPELLRFMETVNQDQERGDGRLWGGKADHGYGWNPCFGKPDLLQDAFRRAQCDFNYYAPAVSAEDRSTPKPEEGEENEPATGGFTWLTGRSSNA
ncbi:hypothetical protein BDP27DRAFT_1362555 [Rhodocollybia butyracea]|uniref:Uncharacterized protein n=1 Tax=Rhodocollybia butyracea TaxID=206335 RepID=A0A9P5PQT1_9AGAR|nr:hypothetical protein BDP27DRAFT_1362555 [Rhodocollybia butyracea]